MGSLDLTGPEVRPLNPIFPGRKTGVIAVTVISDLLVGVFYGCWLEKAG